MIALVALFVREIGELSISSYNILVPVMAGKAIIFLLCAPFAAVLKRETASFWKRWGIYALATTTGNIGLFQFVSCFEGNVVL